MVNRPDSYDRDWPYFINPLPAAASTKESWSDAERYLRTAISDKSTRSDLVVGISDIVKAVWYDPSNNHPTLAYERGDSFPIYLHCLECEDYGNASYTESDIADQGWTFCNNYESASSMRKHSGWSLTPDADEIGIYVLMPDLQTQNKTCACAIEVHANAMKVMSRPFLMWDKPLEGDKRRLFTPDYPKGKNIEVGSSAMRECNMVVFPTFDWPPSNNSVVGCLAWDEPQAFLDYEWEREEDSDDNPVYKTVGFDAVVHSLDDLQPRWKEDFERPIGSAEYTDLTLHCKYCEASKGYLVDDGQTLNDDAIAENGWNTCRGLNSNPKWWIQPSSTFKSPPINGSELSMTAPSLAGNGLEAADSDMVTLGLCSFQLKLALWDNTTEQSTFLQPVMGRPFLLWDHPREDGTRKVFSPDHPRGRNMNSSEMQIQEEADPQAFAGYANGGRLNAGNKSGSDSKLGAGAIAAVVLGAVIGVALIAGLTFLFMRRRRQHSKPERSSPTVDSQNTA